MGTIGDLWHVEGLDGTVWASIASDGSMTTRGAHYVADPDDTTSRVLLDVGEAVPTGTDVTVPADNLIRRTLVTVTAAEMVLLNTTPKTLVAAPGSGLFLEFVSAHLWLDYATTAYDGIATGEDLHVCYTNGSGEEVARAETIGFLDATADAHRLMLAQSPAQDTATTIIPVTNAALVLHMTTGNIATGDSPLIVETFYRVRVLNPTS